MPFLLVANFKSNKTTAEVLAWLNEVGPALSSGSDVQVIIAPQFPALEMAEALIQSSGWQDSIAVCAQNVSAHDEGAFTGEVAAAALKNICRYVIVGHSERRKVFHETASDVQAKVEQAQLQGVAPIICVSEETVDEVEKLTQEPCVFAFEPPAAIGRGKPEAIDVIEKTIAKIRSTSGEHVPVLYGGSVEAQFVPDLLKIPNLGGFLVGSASLDPQAFLEIYHAIR